MQLKSIVLFVRMTIESRIFSKSSDEKKPQPEFMLFNLKNQLIR